MQREQVLERLAQNEPHLRSLRVKSLALFGSVARNEATASSDVDLLVEFDEGHPKSLFEFISVMNFLEDVLGCKVDLVMLDGIRKELREQVLKEAIRAA